MRIKDILLIYFLIGLPIEGAYMLYISFPITHLRALLISLLLTIQAVGILYIAEKG